MTTPWISRTAAGAALLLGLATPATGQTTRLTLGQAIALATGRSEQLEVARAGEARADAGRLLARSQKLPQISFVGTYTRTLASEFSGAFDETAAPAPCDPLLVDASQPLVDRVTELERSASCGAGGGFDLSRLPFGQRNIYQLGFAFAQPIYTGGRLRAESTQADLGRRAAALVTSTTEAALVLDVTQAFYDAALSDRLFAIAESGYDQASATYEQVRLGFDSGRQPEFELLRAQVERDNQRPIVIRRRVSRDIAYLRLRQLLELPAAVPFTLDVDLDAPVLAPPAPFADALATVRAAGPTADRTSVRRAETVVEERQAGVSVARSDRLPQIGVSSNFARVGYPSTGVFPGIGDFRTNWSLGASVQIPLFTGGRIKAGEHTARANLAEAEAVLKQTRELSLLDAATSIEDLAAAEAAFEASTGTVEQAQRAYAIADLRNREGLSTQLELSDSRLSLQVAQANRALAARDLQIARARVALLPNLPVATR